MSENVPPIDPAGESAFQASKSHALQAAEELRAAATSRAAELRNDAAESASNLKDVAEERANALKVKAEQLKEAASARLQDAREKGREYRHEVENYVRANPMKAVLTTFGVGVFVGMLIRR